ncbi:MAG: sec-independent protein translocase protein TatA [Chloroflexota bacterium]|jgi:TatA/E family protein of Tat protein translocase|nr:sec-independent protein translocase protein TatA [Chloroflexota bacterium]
MSFHWGYLIILAVIALIIFGPKRLPELGEGLGKAIKEFRKATTEMGDTLRDEVRKPDTATGTTYTAPAPVEPAAAPPVAVTPPPVAAPPPEAPRS